VNPLLGIPLGFALSTAAGLRVFVPLLLTSLAARAGFITLTPGMKWMASDVALIAFLTAALVEVAAYYIPWVDNLVDAIAAPAAVTAGVVQMAAVTPDLPPLLRWTLAIIAGGTVAGFTQVGTALLRLKSSALTAGAANPIVATGELLGSILLVILGLLLPLLAAVAVIILLVVLARRLLRRRGRPRVDASPLPPARGAGG